MRKGSITYLIKALALVGCLWVASLLAPMLPVPALLLVFVAYALLATVGALYYTTIKRIHREYQLNKEGRLSQINRKWSLMLAVFFLISLVSAFFFVLESPRWDVWEWLLTFLAVPLYLFTYLFFEKHLKNEFDKKFLKARAMKVSFWVLGIVLCLVYAILATAGAATDAGGLREAFEHTPKFFENSSSAFMVEADYVSSFTQGVTGYLITKLSAQFFLVGVIYHFAVYAFVFFGLVNQFAFCLLNKQEIKSEFQLLPANYESRKEQPILLRYIVILVAIAVAASGVFVFLNFEAAQARATGAPTKIEELVEYWTNELLYRFDDQYEKDKEFRDLENQYDEGVREVIAQRTVEMKPLVDAYYDHCRERVDAYLDWYAGFEGQSMRGLKWIPGDFITNYTRDKFFEIMNADADTERIQNIYGEYQNRLRVLLSEHAAKMNAIDSEDVRAVAAVSKANDEIANTVDLWAPLEGDDVSRVVKEILLNENNLDREQLKASIVELIDGAQSDVSDELQFV